MANKRRGATNLRTCVMLLCISGSNETRMTVVKFLFLTNVSFHNRWVSFRIESTQPQFINKMKENGDRFKLSKWHQKRTVYFLILNRTSSFFTNVLIKFQRIKAIFKYVKFHWYASSSSSWSYLVSAGEPESFISRINWVKSWREA